MKPYYKEDGITIYHADCREVLPSLQADVIVTDPPYGMGKAEWDCEMMPVESWLPIAREKAPVALFCGVKGIYDYPKPDWVMSWTRQASTQRNGALQGFNNWEPILLYGFPSLANDVIICPNRREIDGHPTPKPLSLICRLLLRCPDGLVVDPFCGSGTTLVAANDSMRQAIGIEIEERYCEIVAKRLAQGVLKFA